jgi:hypothetical protein
MLQQLGIEVMSDEKDLASLFSQSKSEFEVGAIHTAKMVESTTNQNPGRKVA